ncbi:MAG TPA: VOC family protein, partial [Polyangiaceae bacterium]
MADSNESWYARPVFFVADGRQALQFYGDLGFDEAWRHERDGSVVAAQVNREGVELILSQNPERAGRGRLFVELYDGQVAECVESISAAGIQVTDEHFGMPVKAIRDIDGNEILLRDDTLGPADEGTIRANAAASTAARNSVPGCS